MADIENMIRTRQVQDAALVEVNEKISACKGALHGFKELSDRVTTLPEKLSYDVMVEFGKHAFMPGKIVHTNELMVHLGDAYFASMTCDQALKIIKLRSTNLENSLTDLEKVAGNIMKKADYLGEMSEAQKDPFEIREECPESYTHPKNRRRISRVKEPAATKEDKNVSSQSHDSMMSQLDELQRLEDQEDQMDRHSEQAGNTSAQAQPPIKGATKSQISEGHAKTIKKVHFEDSVSDSVTPTIRFKHSNVTVKTITDMTPGDIQKLVKSTKTEREKPPPKAVAISDVIVERSTTITESNNQATRDLRPASKSKPVSKFKASRMKQTG